MTDFDLCIQALEQKGIEYKLEVIGVTGEGVIDVFCVTAYNGKKRSVWYFYYKNGAEYNSNYDFI